MTTHALCGLVVPSPSRALHATHCGRRRHTLRQLVTTAIAAWVGIALALATWPTITHAQRTAASARSKSNAPTRRLAADSFWVGLWERGGPREDDLVIEPRAIKVSGDLVVVLDLGTREVIGLDARTGKTRFVKAASGTGPGEFKRPFDIVATATTFGVLDEETSRISMFQQSGALLWDAPIPKGAFVESMCAPTAAQLLAKRAGVKNALVLIDSTGKPLATYSVPMKLDSFATFPAAARLAGPTSDGCALVPLFGGRWFAVGTKGVTPFPRIDPGPEPTLKQADNKLLAREGKNITIARTEKVVESPVARGAMVRGDTLIVRAVATTPPHEEFYDYYHVPSGRYVHSRRPYDRGAAWAIGADGVFYATLITGSEARVWALTPTNTPPAKGSTSATTKPPVKKY